MDDLVLQGIVKWPNVPAVFGWLALDRRGNWLLKGEKISNSLFVQFIGRNYARDDRGRWFFQNGPQRVYVALEYAPFVFRASLVNCNALKLITHNGIAPGIVRAVYVDEEGAMILDSDTGPGTLHDQDLDLVVRAMTSSSGECVDDEDVERYLSELMSGATADLYLRFGKDARPLRPIRSKDVARRFGFDVAPVDASTSDSR